MTIKITRNEGEPDCDTVARAFTQPYVRAGLTVEAFTSKGFGVEVGALVGQLKQLTESDNFNTDAMLKAQAQTLDAIFNHLAQIAAMNINNVSVFTPFMKLALQAQNQAGRTLQVISQNKLLNEVEGNNDGVDESKTIEAIEGDKTMATLFTLDGRKVN